MRSVEEVKAQIAKIKADDRYQSGLKHPATIDINAPLALVQLSLETQLQALRWVLSEAKPRKEAANSCEAMGMD